MGSCILAEELRRIFVSQFQLSPPIPNRPHFPLAKKQRSMEKRLFLKKEEVVDLLRISSRTLDYRVSNREITPVRVGKRKLFYYRDVEKLIVQQPVSNVK